MSKNNLRVTTIEELKKYNEGTLVEFPPFAENQRFVARIKRPSMLALAAEGGIPNSLLETAESLFTNSVGKNNVDGDELLKNLKQVIDVLAEATFVSPTYAEIKKSGISLTDEQLMFLFNYTQTGVKALNNFR